MGIGPARPQGLMPFGPVFVAAVAATATTVLRCLEPEPDRGRHGPEAQVAGVDVGSGSGSTTAYLS